MLRDGILTSEGVNSLNWAEEVFYRRLISAVDDFGRFYAAPKLIRAACYPLHIDKVSDSDIGKWLTACVTAALVRVYPAQDGKRYLEILNFRQAVRAKFSKYPAHDEHLQRICDADDEQPHSEGMSSAPVGEDVGEDVGEGGKPAPRKRGPSHKTPLPEGFGISEAVRSWAVLKGHSNLDEHLESFTRKAQAKDYRYVDWDKAFMNAIAEDWGKVNERTTKAVAGGAKPVERGPSFAQQLEIDAKRSGLVRGLDESGPQFRARLDAAAMGAIE